MTAQIKTAAISSAILSVLGIGTLIFTASAPFGVIFVVPQKVEAAGAYTWTDRTAAGSRNWRSITSSSDGTKLAAAVYSGDIYTSSDSGATWIDRTTAGSRTWVSIASSADGTKLAAVVVNGDIYTSSDSGATWIDRTTAGSRNWRSIASSADGTKLAAAMAGGIYTSSDSGATWIDHTAVTPGSWRSIASSADGTKLVAVLFGDIYTSSDSGATWIDRTTAGANSWVSIASSADGTKLAAVAAVAPWYSFPPNGSSGGIFTSTDSGATWTNETTAGSHSWSPITSSSDSSKLAVGTSGGDIYTGVSAFTVPGVPTGLNATANASNISLTWTAPASNGGSAITGYNVYRDTSSPATTLLATTGTTPSYADSTSLVNTTYYYRVTAVNAVGESAFSNEDSDTRPCTSTGTSAGNVSGWAWSDTVGWISLSAADSGTCTSISYGLNIASDGTMSGYAWSENVGWISANASDLTGCPTSPCTARMNGNNMQGWMKVLAANQAEAAWDGFISLSGSNYGPTLASDGTFSGYAWGDTNLGWISFSSSQHSAQTTWVLCTPNYVCTDETHRDDLCTVPVENEACSIGLICGAGQCVIPPAPTPNGIGNELKILPQLVRPGGTVTVTWDISYATSCTVTEDNPDITDSWSGTSGNHTTSAISTQTVYTLSCTGAGGSLTQRATVFNNPNWKEL